MSTFLSPGSDPAHYLKAITSGPNTKIKIVKTRQHSPSKVPIGDVIHGTPTNPIEIGKIISTVEGRSTSDVVNIYKTHEDKIIIETKTSFYEVLDISAPPHRQLSLKYLKDGILDFNDKIPDGFFDGGRKMKLKVDSITKKITPVSDREIILIDARQDQALIEKIDRAKKLIASIAPAGKKAQILMLSMFTSNELGGSQISTNNNETDISTLTDIDIKPFLRKDNTPSYLPLGYLNHGVCRHRALLFKKLADECNIPSRLLRGNYNSTTRGWHIWNVVKIEDSYYVVDVMHNPGELYEENSDKAKKYMRDKNGIVSPGFGGHSVPLKNI